MNTVNIKLRGTQFKNNYTFSDLKAVSLLGINNTAGEGVAMFLLGEFTSGCGGMGQAL